jgi:hypothetical protein
MLSPFVLTQTPQHQVTLRETYLFPVLQFLLFAHWVLWVEFFFSPSATSPPEPGLLWGEPEQLPPKTHWSLSLGGSVSITRQTCPTYCRWLSFCGNSGRWPGIREIKGPTSLRVKKHRHMHIHISPTHLTPATERKEGLQKKTHFPRSQGTRRGCLLLEPSGTAEQ